MLRLLSLVTFAVIICLPSNNMAYSNILNKEPADGILNINESAVLKNAILEVFNAYRQSNLYSIKQTPRNSSNFWNYKFTYNTSLKIPGEKYNMLYSFPFVSSPLDFVSVLGESDVADAHFISTYKKFEQKLSGSLSSKEGWVSSCIKNSESNIMADLEFSNDQYGVVILDYSKNPKGRHVLYLRYLLYSN